MRVVAWIAIALLALGTGCGGGGGAPPEALATTLTLTTFQDAHTVVGQPVFTLNFPNQGGGAPTSQTLASPGMPSAGPFFLPDRENHRVLGYDQIPFLSHIGANFVLGQPGLAFAFPGVGPTALREPLCARVADGRLFVADSGNHRVVVWNTVPSANLPASIAVGQPDLSTAAPGLGAASLHTPGGLAVANGRLLVCDRANHRVLIWNTVPTQSGQPADLVLGQSDFASAQPNAGGVPGAHTLRDPFAVWSDGTRVAVADRGNHRVLCWNTFPTQNGQPADVVLGQPTFADGNPRPGRRGFTQPSDVTSNGLQLFVADAGNHRVLVWNAFPASSASTPDVVLGQASFDGFTPNDKDQDGVPDPVASACTFFAEDGVLTVQVVDGRLFVGDTGNHRVLVFHGN